MLEIHKGMLNQPWWGNLQKGIGEMQISFKILEIILVFHAIVTFYLLYQKENSQMNIDDNYEGEQL